MKKYGPFELKTPTTEQEIAIAAMGISYLEDERGDCWYELGPRVKEENPQHIAIMVSQDNEVLGCSSDLTVFFPKGCYIVLVDDAPEEVINSQPGWTFTTKKGFSKDKGFEKSALEGRKAEEMAVASAQIQVLKDIQEMGALSKDEEAALASWTKFRVEAYRATSLEDFPTRPE